VQSQATTAPHRPQLDLSTEAISAQWARVRVSRLLAAMDRSEAWPVDASPPNQQAVEQIVGMLADAFNQAPVVSITNAVTNRPALTLELMGILRSSRAIAFYAYLDEVDPKISAALVNEARLGSEMGTLLIERIKTLERNHLLSRVFSPERISHVIDLLVEAGITKS
jgi:hypothetical protein